MTDETTTDVMGQAPVTEETTTLPTAPEMTAAPTTPETSTTPSETPEEQDDFDKERALKLITKLRADEKRARDLEKRVLDYERREREAAEAQMSEQERLQTQLKRAEAELQLERQQARDAINRYEVQAHATRLNIVDPDAAVKLLDWSALEYDEDGRPSDVESALKALVDAKPYLVKAAPATPLTPPVPASTTATVATGNPATRSDLPGQRIYTMAEIGDYSFYRAHRADLEAALREGRISQ